MFICFFLWYQPKLADFIDCLLRDAHQSLYLTIMGRTYILKTGCHKVSVAYQSFALNCHGQNFKKIPHNDRQSYSAHWQLLVSCLLFALQLNAHAVSTVASWIKTNLLPLLWQDTLKSSRKPIQPNGYQRLHIEVCDTTSET